MKLGGLFLGCIFLIASCAQSSTMEKNKTPEEATAEGYYKMSGQIVEKEFILKNGHGSGRMELYFRASVQDYFIKLCEGEVSKEDLSPYIDKGITVLAKTVEGEWDQCGEEMVQSRIGRYLIIKEIQ